MTVFYTPITSAFGQNVIANAGSKLFFFETGTTTPKETFADAAETVPNTDPVIADSRGRFGPIFITGAYDVELTDADDVQTWKVLSLTSSGIAGGVVFLGGFDSSTNAGNYPASGAKGDLFVVTTGFTLNPASGSHTLSTRDFIIANIDGATGVDSDWDIIRGVNTPQLTDVSIRPYDIIRAYKVGDYAVASDFKLYRALVAQAGNDPSGGGDPTNWLPIADLLNILTSTDTTRGLTAAQGKVLKDLIDNPVKATTFIRGVKFLPKRIILANSVVDIDHDIVFNFGNFTFDSGNGSGALGFIVKQVDNTWVLGSNAGGLADNLTVTTNTWFHCFALSNPDASTTDAGFDIDINAVNLLADSNVIAAGITEFKLIESRLTNASANWVQMLQNGRYSQFVTFPPDPDFDLSGNIGTAAVLQTLRTPLGRKVRAQLYLGFTETAGVTALFTDPDVNDTAPSPTILTIIAIGTGERASIEMERTTNTLSQIRRRVSQNNVLRLIGTTIAWIADDLED